MHCLLVDVLVIGLVDLVREFLGGARLLYFFLDKLQKLIVDEVDVEPSREVLADVG